MDYPNEETLMKGRFIEMWAELRGHRLVRHPENDHTQGGGDGAPEELGKRDRPGGATVTEGKIQSVGSSGNETPQPFSPPTL